MRVCVRVLCWILLGIVVPLWAEAATYYMAPTGDNGNSGTSAGAAWRTFSFAFGQLFPGDTLILRNGTYTKTSSGSGNFLVNILCGSGARNGTSGSRITVRAETERQAYIQGDGIEIPFRVYGCQYWTFEGLRVSSADNASTSVPGSNASVVDGNSSSNIVWRRLLIHTGNRYANGSIFLPGNNCFVEESELYWWHRNGMTSGNNCIIRRNYMNSRNYPDIPGGRASNPTFTGDSAYQLYPGANNLFENNISENNGGGYEIQSDYGDASGNTYIGNISMGDVQGFYGNARTEQNNGVAEMFPNTTIRQHLVINPRSIGIYLRSAKNFVGNGISVFVSPSLNIDGGYMAIAGSDGGYGPALGDGNPTFFISNSSLVGTPVDGGFQPGVGAFYVATGTYFTWSFNEVNAFTNAAPYTPASHGNLTNAGTVNPQFGTCRVWVPDASPLKGAGVGGADIGANILYRTENGVLTATPLWDPSTGAFPRGATVAGVNDLAGSSLFDVHTRLNVNTNGCAFPAGYAAAPDPPEPVMVAHWRLDEGTGTTAADATGNGHTGTLVGGPTWVPGRYGLGALLFDGSTQYVTIAGSDLQLGTFTLASWVKPTACSSTYQEVLNRGILPHFNYFLELTPTCEPQFGYHNGADYSQIPGPVAAGTGRWTHLAGTYDGTTLRLYVNGLLATSAPGSGLPIMVTGSTTLGRAGDSAQWYFNGALDDPRLYNYALDGAAVKYLFTTTAGKPRRRAVVQ